VVEQDELRQSTIHQISKNPGPDQKRCVVPLKDIKDQGQAPTTDNMAYYMVITSDGFLQSIRGVYDSREKAEARVDALDEECEIVEFDALNQDCDVKY
jgi:hypothetical protein